MRRRRSWGYREWEDMAGWRMGAGWLDLPQKGLFRCWQPEGELLNGESVVHVSIFVLESQLLLTANKYCLQTFNTDHNNIHNILRHDNLIKKKHILAAMDMSAFILPLYLQYCCRLSHQHVFYVKLLALYCMCVHCCWINKHICIHTTCITYVCIYKTEGRQTSSLQVSWSVWYILTFSELAFTALKGCFQPHYTCTSPGLAVWQRG